MLWLESERDHLFELTIVDVSGAGEIEALELTEGELRALWQAAGDALLALAVRRHPAGTRGLLDAVLERRPTKKRRWRR